MSKKTMVWLVMAASFILVGSIMFGCMMTMLRWDFSKLSTVEYETNVHQIKESYQNITVITDTADIQFVPTDNKETLVSCYEEKNATHLVSVQEDTLVIKIVDIRKWYEHIGINFDTPKITVYIPRGEYGALSIKGTTGDVDIPKDYKFESMDISETTGNVTNCASASGLVKIKTDTGNIRVENVSAAALDLSASTGEITVFEVNCQGNLSVNISTGKVKLTDIACENVISYGDTGDISLKNVIVTDKFSIERNTGGVKFDRCDGAQIFVKTDTGDVSGTLLSEKIFICKTDTGRVDVPKTSTGGICEIITDTGHIRMKILS